ncbi:uncharacterized protein LOC120711736 isoform X3 [Panicum virgatum]|uniref:uncharacterized protein LOC120711736 isoform X3 n=1 Tax=Panicum virgatum TaxID=38727 RepID=UPI0019D5E93D|nr:uncharacterized protein LOC120711736 isoform X3 [Panicum virgatum]
MPRRLHADAKLQHVCFTSESSELVAVCPILESSRVCSCLLSQGFLTEGLQKTPAGLQQEQFGEEEKMECWTSNLLKIEFDTKGQQIDSCGTLVAGVVLSSHLLIRDAVNFL